MTAASGAVFTAAQYNIHVRDNMLELGVAKATTIGESFAGSGANSVSARVATASTNVTAFEATASTTWVDLTTVGPSVTVDTGTKALVIYNVALGSNTTNAGTHCAFEVSGATTISASTIESSYGTIFTDGTVNSNYSRLGKAQVLALTPGSNTFKMKYRVSSGTGSFFRRQIIVIPF